jgi:hypothetical protein
MRTRLEFFALFAALVNVVVMIELVRRRKLREKYAFLWLGVGAGGLILGVSRGLLDRLAHAVGIAYPPTLLFVFAVLFLLIVCGHLSWEVSRLEERTHILAEEIALLRSPQTATPAQGVLENHTQS